MNAGRIILLGIALLAGGGAFFLVASGDDTPEVITQALPQQDAIETVRVLVADKDFARGETIDPTATKWVKWPKKNLPEFFVTEENKEFYEGLSTSLARSQIMAGEAIIEAKLVRPGDRGMMSALLTPGMRAVTMDVTASQSAGGFILPGDHVDIYSTINDASSEKLLSNLMYPDVRILAVDQQISQSEDSAIIGRTITLELAPSQVARFLAAKEEGQLSLALRSVFRPEDGEELLQEAEPAEVVVIRYGQS